MIASPLDKPNRADSATPARYLSYAEVAAVTGLRESTLRKYAMEGRMPEPDMRVGRSPGWAEDTIKRWIASRPGRGARTDLAKP